MIKETTTIVDVEPHYLWVEGVQRSTCGSCTARAGCGQRLLACVQARTSRVRVLLSATDTTHYRVGEDIEIGIPDDVVVKGSLLIYLLPLLGLMSSAGLVDYWFHREVFTVGAAVVGLLGGGLVVRAVSLLLSKDSRLQPRVLERGLSLANFPPNS
ncbi:MAG: SoxR reducing system RseC family protein [Porticoccaceae bacterium]|nr:SoxR reducing system RseC family protein [Porticoccaceae bacterium]